MIDIHSHLIHGVDDGSIGVEMSLNMAKEAVKSGFTDIICTPHYMLGQYEISKEKIKEYLELLKQEIKKENIPITLHQGNEIYLEKEVIQSIQKGIISPLGSSKYVLVELPINQYMQGIGNLLYEVIALEYVPILAHPERYLYVQENPKLVYEWIQKGAYIQTNYGSVLGKYGVKAEKTLKLLFKHKMVHFIASDAHRDTSIYMQIEEAKQKLEKWTSKEVIERISNYNPACILQNTEIEFQEPVPYKISWLKKFKNSIDK